MVHPFIDPNSLRPRRWCSSFDAIAHYRRSEPLTTPLRADLVQEFVKSLTDTLEPSCLGHGQIRTGDVPGLGCDLVTGDKVFHRRVVNPRPSLDIAKEQIHGVGNL